MMSHFTVTKRLTFCYGHRLLGYDGPCRHPHGHSAQVELYITGKHTDHNGMLYDFRQMKAVVKSWIDTHLDHRMILQTGDPLIAKFEELGEPVYIMDEPPSAEHMARVIYRHARELGVPVTEVRLWESDTACARYREHE